MPPSTSPARRRPAARDVLAAAIYAVVVLVLWRMDTSSGTLLGLRLPWPATVSTALLVLAAAATVLRSAAPAVMLAVTGTISAALVLTESELSAFVLLFEALWAPIVHGTRRLARTTTALGGLLGLVITLGIAAVVPGGQGIVVALLVVSVAIATPLLWGWEVRHHAEARRTAEDLARTQRELAAVRAERAVEEERRRIAQDLHDVVAGHLAAITLHAGIASTLPDPAARDRSLRTVAESSTAALRDLRSVIAVLTAEGSAVPDATLSWETLARRLDAGEGSSTRIDPTWDDPGAVDTASRAVLLRIGSEAVSNALRHGAPPYDLAVEILGPQVRLRLSSGPSTSRPDRVPDRGTGLGLRAMADRAATVGGTATAGPQSDGSWRVEAVLPRHPRHPARRSPADPEETP